MKGNDDDSTFLASLIIGLVRFQASFGTGEPLLRASTNVLNIIHRSASSLLALDLIVAAMSTSGPAHRVESAVVEYGYPKGHLGHLTPDEEDALKRFRELCIEKGLYNPEDRKDDWGVRDDATLLLATLNPSIPVSETDFALAASSGLDASILTMPSIS